MLAMAIDIPAWVVGGAVALAAAIVIISVLSSRSRH
jgi:hypothetical protein